MTFYSIVLIALALSFDAFGISICIGLNIKVDYKHRIKFAISFGFFQFLFAAIGGIAGEIVNRYIVAVPNIMGGILIIIVGMLMLKEGYENKEECPLINPKMYFVLGISVSIDALVIGFTILNKLNSYIVLMTNSLFIGIVTFGISTIGFIIAKYLNKITIISKYADYLGGVILVLFGIKMIFM